MNKETACPNPVYNGRHVGAKEICGCGTSATIAKAVDSAGWAEFYMKGGFPVSGFLADEGKYTGWQPDLAAFWANRAAHIARRAATP